MEVWDGSTSVHGEVRNVSSTGAFVAMTPAIPIDRGVAFWLRLAGEPILVRGYVRWTRSLAAGPEAPVGFGMEFYDPDGQLAALLAEALPGIEPS
ncbi:MAG: PilZ domain-containing protein [Myxococcales bacterium]|nr:PilZ domain-containing protein [Myxococcales bacterium]